MATAARRSDLYYRLGVFPIHLPPLRERREDLPLLVRHYLRRFSRELGRDVQEVAPEVLERLCDYSWPGNIRELQSVRETLRYKLRDLRLFVTRSFDAAEDNPPRPVRLARRAAQIPDVLKNRLNGSSGAKKHRRDSLTIPQRNVASASGRIQSLPD